MVSFKVVLNDPKTKKSVQKELSEEQSAALLGFKIGEKINGDAIGFSGYEFVITGGSDTSGFPMRKDLEGTSRKKILSVRSTGLKQKRKGMLKRKNVRGNTISEKIAQINMKIIKYGKQSLFADEEQTSGKSQDNQQEAKAEPAES